MPCLPSGREALMPAKWKGGFDAYQVEGRL